MVTRQQRAHIIVLGNAKGGSGKSTTAMHIITRLLALGHRVGAIDLDRQQRTLSRYIENRQDFASRKGLDLALPDLPDTPLPEAYPLGPGENGAADPGAGVRLLAAAVEALAFRNEVVVVDCPGADSFVVRAAHGLADTLLTPLNDSFVDLDLLARIDPDTYAVVEPSWYSEMVWQQRKRRFLQGRHRMDWVVVRNRLSVHDARNKRNMERVLNKLASPMGFRHASGLGDRVIFRELFLKGLTLSDIRSNAKKTGVELTMSHVAAHQEVRSLVDALRLTLRNQQEEMAG